MYGRECVESSDEIEQTKVNKRQWMQIRHPVTIKLLDGNKTSTAVAAIVIPLRTAYDSSSQIRIRRAIDQRHDHNVVLHVNWMVRFAGREHVAQLQKALHAKVPEGISRHCIIPVKVGQIQLNNLILTFRRRSQHRNSMRRWNGISLS